MRALKWTLAATSVLSIFATSSAFAATELAWWHAMTGANNETVERLAKEFNESQSEFKVVPVFKHRDVLQHVAVDDEHVGQFSRLDRTELMRATHDLRAAQRPVGAEAR